MTQNLISSEPTQTRSDWQLASRWTWYCEARGRKPQKIRARQPQLIVLAERAIAEGNRLIHPTGGFRRLDICGVSLSCVTLKGGSELNGFGIARKLAGCQGVFLARGYSGKKLEEEMDKASRVDLPWQFALDGLAPPRLALSPTPLAVFLLNWLPREGLRATSQFYPAMARMPLAEARRRSFSPVDAAFDRCCSPIPHS